MNIWLVKTEPETFSWENLVKEGTSMWEGVRNYQARNNLRLMKVGDPLLFYYSGKNPAIIGLAEVIKEQYPDPTAKEGDWSVVNIKAIRKFDKPVTLQAIKQMPILQNMILIRNSRLSVQPVKPEEYSLIIGMAIDT